ncbi:MAG TPA: Rv3235 family protein [Stackebrandtia sp.]|jgi:hypothetical protein|uniref:Rv3235 family protein n=1 Tax=Stackebrandtia sp. TaxID=2023065 RepID=UPI002D65C713|nr:Rv3235 family protein [Stackebrandtia sp.]HZE41293.1 Rv3235 family protein [Stackebrandtia sp.]
MTSSAPVSRIRLIPFTALLPPAPSPAPPVSPRPAPDVDHRGVAERLVAACSQVLAGRRPVSTLRRLSNPAAFSQFNALHHRLGERARAGEVSLRLSRAAPGARGAIDIVALVQIGPRVRAVAMRAIRGRRTGWQLTTCQLVA